MRAVKQIRKAFLSIEEIEKDGAGFI